MNKWKLEKEKEKEEGKSEEFSESDEGDDEIVNYQCPNCIFSCLKYTQFRDHMLMKHGKSVFCCVTDESINWFLSQNGLRQHCKKCHAETLGCTECGLVCLPLYFLPIKKQCTDQTKEFALLVIEVLLVRTMRKGITKRTALKTLIVALAVRYVSNRDMILTFWGLRQVS